MLTIPVETAGPTPSGSAQPTATVLVIGRSEKVLRTTVDLLRQGGRAAGATNDVDNVLAAFDAASLDLVVFGGQVSPQDKEARRADLATANPAIVFIDGLAGIPGLIVAQVEAAAVPGSSDSASVAYDAESRTITISHRSAGDVRVTAFWGTAFVPPDPESTSRDIFEGTMEEGTHTVPLPASVPDAASFVVVRVGSEVRPFAVSRERRPASPPSDHRRG